jgi:type VI secretion system protein ImpL
MAFEKFLRIITNKWFIHAIGLIFIAAIIWFVGPAIAISDTYILDTISSRLFTITIVLLMWALYQYGQYYLAKKNDAKFAENLTLENAKQDEVHAIQERFNDAILTLKSSSNSKNNLLLNTLPWYIIIGPPGSGKTTALMNSGLEFPLKDKLGADAVRGIGGTRHCDWWFTNEAVLIDTAGRFTTQDSDSDVDKTAWQSFMNMLKKHRKQRPINGALVTMSLSDMLTLTEDELTYYAKTIRKRIEELSQQLGVKFPVYFMFTKCDLVNGFTAYFNGLTAKQRNQVWGETFDITKDGDCAIDINQYDLHFDELLDRLNSQLLLYLKQQNDPAKKADILSFPAQMESMRGAIHHFLVNIFGENRFQETALLRGVYFTSGTQQGSPFDSLLGSVATDMGLTSDENVNYSGRGKSFFISELLSNVIFPESDIAGVNQKQQRWMKRIQFLSLSSAVLVIASLIGIWFVSYNENLNRIKVVEESVAYQESLILERAGKRSTFESILVELDEARAALDIFTPKTFTDNFGLNQRNSFDSQNQAVYLDFLESRLLPLIAHRLEEIMLDILDDGNKADLYSFLKAYLMYAGQHNNANAEFEANWLAALSLADWQNSYPDKPEVIESLANHLDYLFTQSFEYIEPNEKVVAAARDALIKLPLEDQVYASIKDTMLRSNKNDLPFSEIAGPAGLDVFVLRNNKTLDNTFVPGMYTKKGFLGDFLQRASDMSDEYLENTWILGEQNKQVDIPSKIDLQQKIYAIYYREYTNTWNSLIRNIKVAQVTDRQQGFSILRTLSNDGGPLDSLIRTISAQTNLISVQESANAVKGAGEVASVVSSQAQRVISQANRVGRATEKSGLVSIPGEEVAKKFNAFHRLTSTERGDPKILQISVNVAQYHEFINQSLNDNFSDTPAFDIASGRINSSNRSQFSKLTSNSSLNPSEVNNWLSQVSAVGWKLVMQQAKEEIETVWQQQVYNVYEQALRGRYPFDTNASDEVEIADFASFFSPSGTFDGFLNKYISPFVDIKSPNWTLKSFGGMSLSLNGNTLTKLQRSNQITQFFFTSNSTLPNLSFSLLPLSLDANVANFSMNIGAQKISYAHGPRRYSTVTWPLTTANESTKIEFTQLDGRVRSQSELGPWSLFKMLDGQDIGSTARSSTYHATFGLDGMAIKYELRANSEFNPIGAKALQNLTLPEAL